MSRTRAESAALPREQQIATLKEAKGGTWYDDWAPYCMVCTSMARMTERDYGFECRCCRNQIGWDLCRLTDSPLNDAKPAEGGSVSGRMVGMVGAFALPYGDRDLVYQERDPLELMRGVHDGVVYRGDPRQLDPVPPKDPEFTGGMAFDYASLEARVMAQPIRQVIVIGHRGDLPFVRRKPGLSPGMKELATLIKPPSKTDPWAKGSGGKGKRRPLFRR